MEKLALTIALCLLSFTAQADIYKWLGADGTVQYTSTPPQDRPYEVIEKAPPPRNYDPTVLENSRRELQDAVEKAEEQKARRDLDKKDKEVAANMEKNCQIARDNLQNLVAHTGILRQDAKTGTVVRLTAEEREAQLEKARKDVGYFCDDGSVDVSSR